MSGLTFVAFTPREDGFTASVPLEQLENLGAHPELLLEKAGALYGKSVGEMRSCLAEMAELKARRQPITARKVWELGDAAFALVENLAEMSLELDGLYEHLTRDLGINQKRLSNVITFRRYLPDKELIPAALGWAQCEKSARKVAENLSKGSKEHSLGLGA